VVVQHHPQRRHERRVVLQRLAHAHHHHVGDDAVAGLEVAAQEVLGEPQLGHDLAAVRLREKPWWPVEQKRQPTAQPACDDTHSVPRSSSGMNTASTALPWPTSNSHLMVPSADSCWLMTGRPSMRAAVRASRAATWPGRTSGEVARAALVDPAEQLGGAKALLAQRLAERGQPLEVEIEQVGRGHRMGAIPLQRE
jgi:hypothetical protein